MDKAKVRPAPPNGSSIDEMDQFMLWVVLLMQQARNKLEAQLWVRVIMAYGAGHSFQRIADMTRYTPKSISKSTAQRIYADCLARLTGIANKPN